VFGVRRASAGRASGSGQRSLPICLGKGGGFSSTGASRGNSARGTITMAHLDPQTLQLIIISVVSLALLSRCTSDGHFSGMPQSDSQVNEDLAKCVQGDADLENTRVLVAPRLTKDPKRRRGRGRAGAHAARANERAAIDNHRNHGKRARARPAVWIHMRPQCWTLPTAPGTM